ncbi:hypothetical protein K456DRAFT_1880681 [Colletotrichum gloeosporioides 23]|nr:hypothetical protein K456DRAFT_1880681 [Colletotrichum gloeosporioides 23]
MASKCWFVLSQTHYPPPTIPEDGVGASSGPICLGHLIPDLQHLDNVINREGLVDVPASMPIYPTKSWELDWRMGQSKGIDLSLTAGIPVAVAAGLSITSDAGVAFQKTVEKFWQFESLETFIIQPTVAYIEDSLKAKEVIRYFESKGILQTSNIFMVTGIIVARGATFSTGKSHSRAIYGGPGVVLASIAEFGGQIGSSQSHSMSSSAHQTTDFVWAVRLAKISKGLIDRKWTHKTLSRGATFGLDDVDSGGTAAEALRQEGLRIDPSTEIDVGPDTFVFSVI